MKLGDFTVQVINDCYIGLDGGAMFGVVPRPLWERKIRPNGKNRIRLATNCLYLDTGGKKVLVNTGVGEKVDAEFKEQYTVERGKGLVGELARQGVEPEEIDLVINTHLHFDHCGGNTCFDQQGNIRSTFPRARYLVQREEYEGALPDTARNRASYFPADFQPLLESGQLELLDGNTEILPGISVEVVPGHTRGMQCVKITSQGQTLYHPSDLLPTSHHVRFAWVMAYDLFPLETLENKKKVVAQAAAEHWLMLFEHDPDVPLAYIKMKDDRPLVKKLGGTL